MILNLVPIRLQGMRHDKLVYGPINWCVWPINNNILISDKIYRPATPTFLS